MVVEAAIDAGATETAMEVAGEAAVTEGVVESSISGATELSETLAAIEKELPREIINGQVDGMLQDEAFRAEVIPNIETINQHLEGTVHPETGVPFDAKLVETNEGFKEGVFPDFSENHCVYDAQLPEDLHKASDYEQAKHLNEQLYQTYENGTLDTDQFADRQLEQIRNGDKPEGYTWHHHEEPGRMQLVDTEVHAKTLHTGGRSIWGGGREAR